MTPFFSTREALFASFGEHVNAGKIATFQKYGFDAVIGRREGARFFDAYSDRAWWNCHCNGGVFNLGHRHPAVVEALKGAVETLDIGNHHLPSPHRAELARRLVATTDDQLSGVVFGVSGGEAIDLAIKVVRAGTRRSKIISVQGGYHGHTGLAMAAGDPSYRAPFGPDLPGFVQLPFDDLEALAAELDEQTAAVLVEPVPATLGMPIHAPGYLRGVSALCTTRGAKLIVDEVQTGLGRTGRLWCYQHEGITPDVLVTGKGLSGGLYPITATLMTRELHSLFDREPFIHISTFGGAELGCAAALAVLGVIEAPGFLVRVNQLAARFEAELSGMPFTLRSRGLMMGLKFPVPDAGMFAAKLLFDEGIFAVYANNDTSVLQFLPPLTLRDEEATQIINTLRKVFS
jgi:putrescine aminotransferase